MTGWGTWARCALAASSCGVITVLAGCSAGTAATPTPTSPASVTSSADPQGGSAATISKPTGSAGAAGTVAPLTGLTVTAATAQRPAVAVAVAGSDPVGLGSADLVFEEITSPVRYLAVFQSDQPGQVGPVTSTRPEDGPTLSVLHPLTSYDGGTSSFISVLDATKIIDDGYAEHSSLYSAGSDGLTVSAAGLAAAGGTDGPPPPLFFYRTAGTSLASAQGTYPTSVRVDIPGQPVQQWDFDAHADRWVETAGGPRVSVANLVVQIVAFKTVYLSRKYGETVPSAHVLGTGVATVFSGTAPGGSGGTAATGIWSKPGLTAVTNYLDAANEQMNFAPGPTWIILAPAGTRTSQVAGGRA